MRRVVSLALAIVFASFVSGTPNLIAQGQTGTVTGTAVDANKNPLANHTVRLRNVATGEISASTTSAANGTFSSVLPPGNYVVEIVNAAGNIVGTSSAVAVTAGAVTTVTVTATAVAAAAAAAAAAGGAAGLFGLGVAGTVLAIAVVAGVVIAVVATQDDASPSR